MATAGWLGADYLSPEWVDDGYLRKQELILSQGAWVNEGWISRKYVAETWLHYVVPGVGATIAVDNVPGLAIVVLDGSARQTTKVNATTTTVPLATFAAVANAGTRANQANVPGLPLAVFSGTANGSVYQVADVTFTIEVASTFGYTKLVTAQNVPPVALAAVDAIVTTGTNVNIAVTKASLPLVALATTAKANASTRAISSVPTPIGVFDVEVAVGRQVLVLDVPAVALVAIPVAVTAFEGNPNHVFASVASLGLGVLDTSVSAVSLSLGTVVYAAARFKPTEEVSTMFTETVSVRGRFT